jgi:methionine synthase II (cobalamin-independent)
MTLKDTTCKIHCCFADEVYNKLLNKKYGVEYCNNPSEKDVDYLHDLKELFNYYNIDDEDTSVHVCNFEKIKELINIL